MNQVLKVHELLQFFLTAGTLKRVRRAGWIRRKIRNPESVAEHSFRTAVMAAALAPPGMNREKVVTMALIHELGEAEIGDITPYDGIPVRKKHQMEDRAMKRICRKQPHFYRLWKELESGKTMEARFVKQLDRLEMYLQALEYEQSGGRNLGEFFSDQKKVTDARLKKLLREIHAMRPRTSGPRR